MLMLRQDIGGSGVYPNKGNSFEVIQNNVALCAYEWYNCWECSGVGVDQGTLLGI
jgi:hypothetical protein